MVLGRPGLNYKSMYGKISHEGLMIIRRGIVCSLALVCFSVHSLIAQVSDTGIPDYGQVEGNFEELNIQTDRDIYISGEDVFFRINQMGRLSHNPGTISKVVYIDLLDNNNTSAVQVKAGSDGITSAGVLRIPDTLRTGHYFIRSFTNQMKNYSQSLFAYKRITVINPFESLRRLKIPPSDHQADSIIIYPETGSFIQGVISRAGILCYNSNGDPVVTDGIVTDTENDTLARFRTDRYGTALFSLKPETPGDLFVITSDDKGTGRKFPAPPVKQDGVSFTANADRKSGILHLTLRGSGIFSTTGGLVSAEYSPLCFSGMIKSVLLKNEAIVSFEMNSLPAGLALITVRDANRTVLASRWYYNESKQDIVYNLKVIPGEISPRRKVTVNVNARDENGEGINTTLAVSVVRPVLIDENPFRDLSRHVQMSSLQAFSTGIVTNDLNDYLIFCEEDTALALLSDDSSAIRYLPEPDGHLIYGYIRDRNTGAPLSDEDISLSFVGSAARCSFTSTDDNGRFIFPVREYGKKEIVIQRLSEETRGYFVDLNYPFLFETKLDHKPGPCYLDTTNLEAINDAVISMQVKRTYDPFLRKETVTPFHNHLPDFFGEPDRTIMLSDFIELTTLREVFKEIVPELLPTGRNERSSLRLISKYPGLSFNGPPLVILDGVPVYDLEDVLKIRASEIKMVKVMNSRYFIRDVILNGIIDIVTEKGDLSVLESDRSVLRQEYDMLLPGYEIPDPDYSSDTLRNGRIPDFRNTVYWNPVVTTDSNGNASIEFWTSDEEGEYVVVAEGFSIDGRSGRSITRFTVSK
jgi:hypothetical protein